MSSFFENIYAKVEEEMKKIKEGSSGSTNVESNTNSVSSSLCSEYTTKVFELPIEYLEDEYKHTLSSTVVSDLELVETLDETIPSMYESTCSPVNPFSKHMIPQFQKSYTTSIPFLTETQQVVENMGEMYSDGYQNFDYSSITCENLHENWKMVKHDPKFVETYGYLEWNILKEYNKNSIVLQSLTISNMLAPVMSFFIPILFLLFPFVILKIQGIPISLSMYFQILKDVSRNHFIGQALSIYESFSIQKLVYLLCMLGLYLFQMYQNTMQCIRFYRNMQRINNELCVWKEYRMHCSRKIKQFLDLNKDLETYKPFCDVMKQHQIILEDMRIMLDPVKPFVCSIMKTTETGYMLKCYYELHTDEYYEQTLLYCMGLDGYLGCMYGIYDQWKTGIIAKAEYMESDDSVLDESGNVINICSMENQYYPAHKNDEDCVKNDVNLDTYGVITGPNASGKTTYLKTTAINVILSQQFGFGFYSKCKMHPYTHIHSYLNIPDTSGRDSLFQAESRRCKHILETIQNETNGYHFCIFDELYSGTNPHEATQAAYAFLQYLRKYNHVDLFLTTHYVSICDRWNEDIKSKEPLRHIQNYKMKVESLQNGNHTPLYKIEPGVSRIEGAINILTDMNYPKEMLSMIQQSTNVNTAVNAISDSEESPNYDDDVYENIETDLEQDEAETESETEADIEV